MQKFNTDVNLWKKYREENPEDELIIKNGFVFALGYQGDCQCMASFLLSSDDAIKILKEAGYTDNLLIVVPV